MVSPLDLVKEHLAAEDRRDVAAVLATFAEDCIYRIPAYGIDLAGKRDIGDFYAGMFRSFPDFENVSTKFHVAEQAIFVEVVTERTHNGQWGRFGPSGKHFRSSSLAQFPVTADGQLGGEIVHLNPAHALHEIGALPSSDVFDVARRVRGPLAGRVALVTGASRGIGRAIATGLAEAGADVALAARDAAALDDAAQEAQRFGTHVETFVVDVTSVAACRELVEAVHARFGRLDVLVNAAGGTRRGPAAQMSEADWDAVQDVNLKSVFFMCQAAARHLPVGGSIVNVASLNSVVGNAWAASYAASKGGLTQLTKSLALEWAADGIRVNAIGPGFVETDMTAAVFADPAKTSAILQHIPMGRLGKPADLAGAAVFLASDASSYMTGQVVFVDGGYLSV